MSNLRVTSIFLVAVVATHAATQNRPRPGSPPLGAVLLPNFGVSGWGWQPTEAPSTEAPPTGWPATEAPPTGWPATEAPPTGWPATEAPPTGWPATEAPPTGWPATEAPGWPAPPTTGWAPAPGWPAPVGPIDIEMAAESAVLGAGEAGATHGSQTVVTGDASNPAVASIQTGSYSNLGQGSSVYQVSSISNTGESNTFHGVDGYNYGDAGEYYGASATGNTIQSANGGASFVVGQGAIGQGGLTENSNPNGK